MGRRRDLPPGIRKTPFGFEAYVRVHGVLYTKRYKPDTPIREMKEWVAITRGDKLTTTSPFAPKPKGRRGAFDADARNRYLPAVKAMPSYSDRERHIEEWIAVFKSRPRRTITPDEIRAHLNALFEGGLAASSVNHRRTALMHLFTVLDTKAAPNPVRDVPKFREPAALPRGVDYAILEKVFAKMPKGKHYARALVFAYVGIPPSLLKRMTEADVNYEEGTALVPERRKGKGSPARLVPLTPNGLRAFKAMRRYDAWGSFSRWRMGKMWKEAQIKAKVKEHIRVYDLRHSFGTMAYLASGDLHATQELLGHSSPALTARYALAAVPARLRAAVERLSVPTPYANSQNRGARKLAHSVNRKNPRESEK